MNHLANANNSSGPHSRATVTKHCEEALMAIHNPTVKNLLKEVDRFDFDIFKLRDETYDDELFTLTYSLLTRCLLLEAVGIDEFKFIKFIKEISSGYK
jgi:hypothetical protein